MRIIVNTAPNTILFPGPGGQEWNLHPLRDQHQRQPHAIYAVIAMSEPVATREHIERNLTRKFFAEAKAHALHGLRAADVVVLDGENATRLDNASPARSPIITPGFLAERFPKQFPLPDPSSAVATTAPIVNAHADNPAAPKPNEDTRTPYVYRDGGYTISAWRALKIGDRIMLRESDGTYFKDGDAAQFLVQSLPVLSDGRWKFSYIPFIDPLSQPTPSAVATVAPSGAGGSPVTAPAGNAEKKDASDSDEEADDDGGDEEDGDEEDGDGEEGADEGGEDEGGEEADNEGTDTGDGTKGAQSPKTSQTSKVPGVSVKRRSKKKKRSRR